MPSACFPSDLINFPSSRSGSSGCSPSAFLLLFALLDPLSSPVLPVPTAAPLPPENDVGAAPLPLELDDTAALLRLLELVVGRGLSVVGCGLAPPSVLPSGSTSFRSTFSRLVLIFLHAPVACMCLCNAPELLFNPLSAVFRVRLSRRPLEQRPAPGASRCESEPPNHYVCAHFATGTCSSSALWRHGTATIINWLLRSHLCLAVFHRTVLVSHTPFRFPTMAALQIHAMLPHARHFCKRASRLLLHRIHSANDKPCTFADFPFSRSCAVFPVRPASNLVSRSPVRRSTARRNASHQSSSPIFLYRAACCFRLNRGHPVHPRPYHPRDLLHPLKYLHAFFRSSRPISSSLTAALVAVFDALHNHHPFHQRLTMFVTCLVLPPVTVHLTLLANISIPRTSLRPLSRFPRALLWYNWVVFERTFLNSDSVAANVKSSPCTTRGVVEYHRRRSAAQEPLIRQGSCIVILPSWRLLAHPVQPSLSAWRTLQSS